MAQCFISTYRNHYRGQQQEVTPPCPPFDTSLEAIPPEDIWMEPTIFKNLLDDEELLLRMHKSNLKRMISTYQVSYCKDMIAKFIGEPIEEGSFGNQLLVDCKNLYQPDVRPKIAPPIRGTRRTFGYIRPTRNYTPLTDYQDSYGKTGYKILKGDFRAPPEETQGVQSKGDEKSVADNGHKPVIKEPTCDCKCCMKKFKKK